MNPKISQALSLLAGCPASDFAELAILAADQAGMSADDQDDLRRTLIPPCVECLQPTGGYSDELCECCHDELARAAARQARLDAYEGRGDYERDMRKDAR